MVLTNEQLRATLTGAAETTEENGILTPFRFGRYVRESTYGIGNTFHYAMAQTSGIVSRFLTDSEDLAFSYTVSEPLASQTFDVWANGIFYASVSCSPAEGRATVKLPKGEKLITIYYPHHADGKMFDVALGTGAKFALAPKQNTRILFIGDSITHGSSAAQASMSYAHQVARVLDAEVVNQGISGEGFNPAAVDSDLDFTPDLVSVSYGTNDWSHSPSYEDMEARANNHLQALRLKHPDAKIAVILPIWRADYTLTTKKVGSFEDARTLLREAAARVNATVIDGMLLVPHVTEVFADARLHPSALGFQFYAENLAPHFKKILEK